MRRAALAAAACLAAAALAAGCGESPSPTGGDSSAFDGRSPRVPSSDRVRVLVQLRRPSLGDELARTKLSTHDAKAYVASLEKEVGALLSALRAKNVQLGHVVTFARVWHGFAATVRASDLPAVQALGLRVEPVRRFYGAAARVVPAGPGGAGAPPAEGTAGHRPPAIALLDSGVARDLPALRGRVRPGFDAVGGDRDPSPVGPAESHGTELAGVLAAGLPSGERIISIRVAGLQRDPVRGDQVEVGETDQLLAGLEHAVDPNGNGDVSDAVPIALAGVSSPYAGFSDSPEAQAVRAAGQLGTLTIAPAGNEGPTVGAFGTMGSPGAAPAALAVGALDGKGPAVPGVELGLATPHGRAELDGALLGGGGRALRAPAAPLSGPSQAAPRGGGRAAGGDPLEYLTVDARPKVRGRVVVVPYRGDDGRSPTIADRAASAEAAGAVALVVCQPNSGKPLAALPPGTSALPVIGLTGDAARQALDLTTAPGGVTFVSAPERRHSDGSLRPGRSSSRGPTYSLAPKPDLAEPGTAETFTATGARVFASGTSVAAARAAIAALVLHRRAPTLLAPQLAAALVATARPQGTPLAAGAGQPNPIAASHAAAVPGTSWVAFPIEPPHGAWSARAQLTLSNPAPHAATLRLSGAFSASGIRLAPTPARLTIAPNASATVTLTATAPPHRPAFATGRLIVRGPGTPLAIPVAVAIESPPRPRLGGPSLLTRAGRVIGARFAVGAVHRTPDGIAVQPVQSLALSLVDSRGTSVRELTPAGGAPDVLPGEYSYTLPPGTTRSLRGGDYRFRVRVLGTAGGTLTAESAAFRLR